MYAARIDAAYRVPAAVPQVRATSTVVDPVDIGLTRAHSANRHYDEEKTDARYDFSRFLAAHKAQLPALTEVRVDTIVGPHVEYVSPLREFC